MADRFRDDRGERPPRSRGDDEQGRGFLDRAQDEMRSWLGDEGAARRRRRDAREGGGRYRPGARDEYDADATLGGAYSYDPRGGGRRAQGGPAEGPGPDDATGAVSRGWNEPTYGYRPAAGYDYDREQRRYSGRQWDSKSPSGYGVGWQGGWHVPDGQFAGRGPKGYVRSDARVQEEVCERLADAPDVDASDIEVHVSGGEVTLSGAVGDRTQKRRAEDLIDDVAGVREVHNQLRLSRPESR